MTTHPDHDHDVAALQRLPEDEQPPGVLDPTCVTTGVTGQGVSRPAGSRSDEAGDEAGDNPSA